MDIGMGKGRATWGRGPSGAGGKTQSTLAENMQPGGHTIQEDVRQRVANLRPPQTLIQQPC
eukprot:6736278-Lingulodinium_polyedra.AAC.1